PQFYVEGAGYVGGAIGLIASGSSLTNLEISYPTITLSSSYGNDGGKAFGGAVGATITSDNGDSRVAVNNVNVTSANLEWCEDAVFVGGIVGLNEGRTLTNLTLTSKLILNSRVSTNSDADFGSYSVKSDTALGNTTGGRGFGGGGIIGYNKSYFSNGVLKYSGTLQNVNFADIKVQHELSGSILGGIAGINGPGSTITEAKTYANRFTTKRGLNEGGVFGVIVGYNAGIITQALVKEPNSSIAYDSSTHDYITYFVTTQALYFNATQNIDTTPEGDPVPEMKSGGDSTTIFLGGIAGYNTITGTIANSEFQGVLLVNRIHSQELVNRTAIGALAGAAESTYRTIHDNSVHDSKLATYTVLWVDAGGAGNGISGTPQEIKLGMFAGHVVDSGTFQSNYGQDNNTGSMYVGSGSAYSDWPMTTLLVNLWPSGNGSVTYSGTYWRSLTNLTNNDNNIKSSDEVHRTNKNIPSSDCYTKDSSGIVGLFAKYYVYSGHYRNVNGTTENYTNP
ncbi:MAG: hypothetical protein LBE09_01850, partial [Christensenellaceae bacterium]|nr:hypothetical protein [Christensenellaceae bacterium]